MGKVSDMFPQAEVEAPSEGLKMDAGAPILSKQQRLDVLNELVARGDVKPELANELRTRITDSGFEETRKKPTWAREAFDWTKNLVKDHGVDALEYAQKQAFPYNMLFAAKDLVQNLQANRAQGKGIMSPGGTADTELLHGQFPTVGATIGAAAGPLGAGLGGATGLAVERSVRQATGLEGKNLPRGTLGETVRTNLASQANFAQDMLPEFAKQAALAYGGQKVAQGIGKGLNYVAEKQIATRVLPERMKKLPGFRWLVEGEEAAAQKRLEPLKATHKAEEVTRKEAWAAGKARAADETKSMPETITGRGRTASGAHFKESVAKANEEMGARYDATVKPVLNAYGKVRIPGQQMRNALLSPLQEQGFIDAKGNILRGEIDKIKTPELKKYYSDLADWVEQLQRNPTFREADRIRKDMQNAAFKQRRSEYAPVAHEYRVAMLDSLGEASDPATRRAISSAREEYSRVTPYMKQLREIAESHPEEIVAKIGKNSFPLSYAIEAAKVVPSLKEPIQSVVLNGLVRAANNPQAFKKTIDDFGRKELAQVLDPKTMKAVLDYEQRMFAAFKPFQGRPFQPPGDLDKGLGKFWQKMYDAAKSGAKMDPASARVLFTHFGNALERQVRDQTKPTAPGGG